MKTVNKKGMMFGFTAVNSGKRNVAVEPQVIAVSTSGSFRLTPPVSRALGIAHGDYAMFINNVDGVTEAINSHNEQVVAFCEANGLEIGTPEAAKAIHQEFDMWVVAKGIVEYDLKGNQKITTERLTKNDKVKFVSQNFDEMFEQAMEQADDETKDALSREGITKDEQIDILTAFVTPRELPKYRGSKCANPAGLSGTGISVNFTDSNIWNQLKADLGDNADKINRIFDVDVEDLQEFEINNGYKNITVKGIILGNYTDKEPSRNVNSEEE